MNEVILALILIIGLMEYREYRQALRMRALNLEIKSLKRAFQRTSQEVTDLVSMEDNISLIISHAENLKQSLEEVRDLATAAKLASETIVNEYEINGIPLGYERGTGKKADFIEG